MTASPDTYIGIHDASNSEYRALASKFGVRCTDDPESHTEWVRFNIGSVEFTVYKPEPS